MTDEIKNISAQITPLLKNAGVIRSAIFGSRATGNVYKDSDLDLLVEFGSKKTLLDLSSLKRNLEAKLNMSVDLLTFRSLNSRLRKKVEKEAVDIL
ncbi:MAG: nucleotidyltransferase family protein [bacterium]|nr:nucleotidyltransferase family protein [bacterium]